MATPVTIWEVPVSGYWIDEAQTEPCEIVCSWLLISDYYCATDDSGRSFPKVEVREIIEAYGLESGADYTASARQTYGLKSYLEEIITERLEV